VGERSDSTVARTNALGLGIRALPPGRYRAIPSRPVDFEGKRYEWDIPFSVRMGRGMRGRERAGVVTRQAPRSLARAHH
jgi:hypothetical protein